MVLLLQYTLTFASVLILVALGGCFSEHSGVINLGLEGVMIMGALGGALAMRYMPTGSSAFSMLIVVLLAAALAGTVYSSLLAVACINFKADQTIVGTALNMLGTAGATVIVKAINTAANPDDVSSTIQYAGAKKAFLVNIGSFEFSWFMLVTLLLLIAAYVALYKTRFGLRLMACGEHPQAADSVGINVYKMRWAGVLISGMLGGLGGIVFIYRKMGPKEMYSCLKDTVSSASAIMALVAFANVFAFILTKEHIPSMIADAMLHLTTNKYLILLLINLFLIFVGMFMETIAAILILFPTLLAVATAVGVDPIQFGIIVVMNLVLGLCTPPVGVCLFAATNIGARYGKCTLSDSVKALVPLLIVNFGVLFLVTYVPFLTVGVANLVMG